MLPREKMTDDNRIKFDEIVVEVSVYSQISPQSTVQLHALKLSAPYTRSVWFHSHIADHLAYSDK